MIRLSSSKRIHPSFIPSFFQGASDMSLNMKPSKAIVILLAALCFPLGGLGGDFPNPLSRFMAGSAAAARSPRGS